MIYSGYCSIKCNLSCSVNCDYCGGKPGFASKYMLNISSPLKPIPKKNRILNHPSIKESSTNTYDPITTTSSKIFFANYGCVIFNVPGDYYFDLSNQPNQIPGPNECLKDCLNANANYQFFIISYFSE